MESNLRSSEIDEQLARIGAELRAVLPWAGHLVLFGSARSAPVPADLDMAVIIPDSMDAFEAASALAPVLARLIVQEGRLVSCFPITVSRFQKDRSQFMRNVRRDGQPI